MNSPKNYVILLLAAAALGSAMLAWRQYGELVELRASALNRDERAELQKRVWDLEKMNRDLQARLAARGGPADVDELLAAAAEGAREPRERGGRGERGGDPRGRGGSGMQQANAVRELMSKPEVQAMLSLQQKAAVEARYAALFKNLNLTPDQVTKLTALLADRGATMQDVMAAAREQGINPRENPEAFRKIVADAQNAINDGIKSVIGEPGFAQLATYEQTLPQRNLVNELQQRLSFTSTPLTATQAEQMVQILAANTPPRTPNTSTGPQAGPPSGGERGGPPPPGFGGGRGGDIGGLIAGVFGGGPGMSMMAGAFDGGGRGGSTAPVTSAAVVQAQTVLVPSQVAALQQIQQQQQTQQQLRQLVHDTLTASQPTPNTSNSTGSPSVNPDSPPRRRGGGG